MRVVTRSELPDQKLLFRGKVRDVYELDPERLLIVTTDRVSAFDVVMDQPVPYRGVILNQITLFWMNKFSGRIKNHLLASCLKDFPPELAPYADQLAGRSVVVKKTAPLLVECIARGYITGSGWEDYKRSGEICGQPLPAGLKESEKLPQTMFTPSTKAELGSHDQNISLDQAEGLLGAGLFKQVRDMSVSLFEQAGAYALEQGIIIADTKFEFGLYGSELILIDEVLTPDSSRFWPVSGYAPGRGQPSFDKQYLRDWLKSLDWNKEPPPPALPEEVVAQTAARYAEAYERLIGHKFDPSALKEVC